MQFIKNKIISYLNFNLIYSLICILYLTKWSKLTYIIWYVYKNLITNNSNNNNIYFNGGLININFLYTPFWIKKNFNSTWTPYFKKDGYYGFFIDNVVWN